MTPQEIHRQQRDMVRASLLLSEDRTERHQIYVRHDPRPCPVCKEPREFLWCRCAMKDAA